MRSQHFSERAISYLARELLILLITPGNYLPCLPRLSPNQQLSLITLLRAPLVAKHPINTQ